jgi:hypothetical protein
VPSCDDSLEERPYLPRSLMGHIEGRERRDVCHASRAGTPDELDDGEGSSSSRR